MNRRGYGAAMPHRLEALLREDDARWRVLGQVRALGLPDAWIAAGFVRSAVWDHLHGRQAPHTDDVDVVWHCPGRATPEEDARAEAMLRALDPGILWSVRNQARMHARNGDAPYASVPDAMRCWPETATAVAVRRTEADGLEVAAPFGLEDLFGLVIRPTPRFATDDRLALHRARVAEKGWLARWPKLRVLSPAVPPPGPAGR